MEYVTRERETVYKEQTMSVIIRCLPPGRREEQRMKSFTVTTIERRYKQRVFVASGRLQEFHAGVH